jgi:hypothetical protein
MHDTNVSGVVCVKTEKKKITDDEERMREGERYKKEIKEKRKKIGNGSEH